MKKPKLIMRLLLPVCGVFDAVLEGVGKGRPVQKRRGKV
jgi:hypothetical protein